MRNDIKKLMYEALNVGLTPERGDYCNTICDELFARNAPSITMALTRRIVELIEPNVLSANIVVDVLQSLFSEKYEELLEKYKESIDAQADALCVLAIDIAEVLNNAEDENVTITKAKKEE